MCIIPITMENNVFSEETKYDIMKDDSCSLLVKHMITAIQGKAIHGKYKTSTEREPNKNHRTETKTNNSSNSNSSDELNTLFSIDSIGDDEKSSERWSPPKEHGLSNSIRIIPEYYMKRGQSFINIGYYDIIVDDIRNMRKLNEYQMKYIKEELDEERKNNLLDIFNDVLESIGNFF